MALQLGRESQRYERATSFKVKPQVKPTIHMRGLENRGYHPASSPYLDNARFESGVSSPGGSPVTVSKP